jgi:hypothetical protein
MSASSNALSIVPNESGINIERVIYQRGAIQRLLKEVLVMGIDRDYAIIPGTKKYTLLKPGAEKIASMFGIAVEPIVVAIPHPNGEDMTYRVTARLTTSNGGVFLGEGVGEASTLESKFAWRACVCPEEWQQFKDADPSKARIHWMRGNPPTAVGQVRENPADKGNNMLKIAKKRALIDAILTATAASDTFTQDKEPEDAGTSNGAAATNGQGKAAAEELISEDDAKKFFGVWKNKGKHTKENVKLYLQRHCGGITDDRKMPKRCYADAMKWAATEGAPVPEMKAPEPAKTATAAQSDAPPIGDPHIIKIREYFGFLGTKLDEQGALFAEYRDRMPELEVELKSRLDAMPAEEG